MTKHLRLYCAALVALCAGFSTDVSARSCDGTVIDQVWTGVVARFGSVATDRYAVIAYYNAGRQLTVTRIDLESCVVERKHLPSVFKGWDSHKYTTMAIDHEGRIHVAGNMHNHPLTYFRGREPLDVGSIEQAGMIGRDEDRVTYPRFKDVRGRLGFLYRAGHAGNGEWYMNTWTGDRWRRLVEKPIFGDSSGVLAVSAYPSFDVDSDGFFHVVVVWRGGPGVQSNFRVSYAKTHDFGAWFDHAGRSIPMPLVPNTMDTVEDLGRDKGLVNNAKVSASDDGTPYVTYTKYTESGRNGVYLARPEGDRWQSTLLAESEQTAPIEGGGSIRRLPRFSGVRFVENGPVVDVRFPGERPVKVRLKGISTSEHVTAGKFNKKGTSSDKNAANSRFASVLPLLRRPKIMTSRARGRAAHIQFRWVAQALPVKAARQCSHKASLPECSPPPSPLIFQEKMR